MAEETKVEVKAAIADDVVECNSADAERIDKMLGDLIYHEEEKGEAEIPDEIVSALVDKKETIEYLGEHLEPIHLVRRVVEEAETSHSFSLKSSDTMTNVEVHTASSVKHQPLWSNRHTVWQGSIEFIVADNHTTIKSNWPPKLLPVVTICAFNGHKMHSLSASNAPDTSIAGIDVKVTRGDSWNQGSVDASDFDELIKNLGVPGLTFDHLVRFSITRLKPRMLGDGHVALANWLANTVGALDADKSTTVLGDDELWWQAYKTLSSTTA